MSQIVRSLDQQQLKALCGVVAHTSQGLTKSELTVLLGQCGICAVDDGSSRSQWGYTIKPFDEDRIIDSYDCIEKFNQHSEQKIREVIVICRPKDCPAQIRASGHSFYIGSIDYQSIRYYFWNIYEWIVSMLQRMPDEGKEYFLISLNNYINDINTAESVKNEWRKIQGIE